MTTPHDDEHPATGLPPAGAGGSVPGQVSGPGWATPTPPPPPPQPGWQQPAPSASGGPWQQPAPSAAGGPWQQPAPMPSGFSGAPGQPHAPVPAGGWGQPVADPNPWAQAPGWQQPAGYPGGTPVAAYGPPPVQPQAYQPGIVPLRPLSVWEIFDGAFRAIRHNPKVMFGLTAVVVTLVVALSSLLTWYVGGLLASEVDSWYASTGSLTTADLELFGSSVGSSVVSLLAIPLTSIATQVLTGLLIVSVSRSVIDRHTQVGDVVRGNGKRLVWVVCFTLLVTMATSVVAVGVLFGAIMLGVALDSLGLAVLGFLGGLVLVVPVEVWLRVRTMLVPAGLMLEGGKFWATVARAWRLTRGSFWRLTGLYLLVWILTAVVSGIITVPGSMIATVVMDDPMLTSGGAIAVSAVSQVIALTLTTVFSAGVVALAYIDARMRREGLDVELARAMQAPA